MRVSPSRAAYLAGVRDGAPFAVVIVPFAMLFGAAAAEAGWSVAQIMKMSIAVIAGASQFAALQLLSENAPVLIVILTALAINLRMAMYSASMAPHVGATPLWQRVLVAYALVDQTYGAAIHRYTLRPEMTQAEKLAYFFGAVTPVCGPWYFASYAGAVVGAAIPPEFALDFAVPITFIAIVAPWLRSPAHLAAAVVSVSASLALVWVPLNLWLLIAAGLAMVTGAAMELALERRR